MMKLCKLSLYMLLSVLSAAVMNGLARIMPCSVSILPIIVIFAGLYEDAVTGALTGAAAGLAGGAFSENPLLYLELYALLGFAAGFCGRRIINKNYVNVTILSMFISMVLRLFDKVDIMQNLIFTFNFVLAASLVLYFPLNAVNRIGGRRWAGQ